MTPAQEQEYHDEAKRLAQLPRDDQAAVVAMYWHLAGNSLATKACRAGAAQKAAALEKLLGLKSTKKPAKAPGQANRRKGSTKANRNR